MAAAITRGVQATPGNYVTIKHLCANNQENNRYYVSSEVDERVLREIYWKGFEIVVREASPRSLCVPKLGEEHEVFINNQKHWYVP